MRQSCLLTAGATLLLAISSAQASVIWSTGPNDVSFTKPGGVDETNPIYWDKISSDVWITRGLTKGLYNPKTETVFNDVVDPAVSPADTQWAFSEVDGNPAFTYGIGAAQHANLTFNFWEDSLGGANNLGFNILAHPAVLHIVSQDIFLDIQFTSWQQHGGGGFAYTRAAAPAAVPEPASLGCLALTAAALLLRRQRRPCL